jgi:hypothetical protein
MEPKYAHLDRLLQGGISRREFFLKMAAAGACTPFVMDFLKNGPSPAFAQTPTSEPAAKLSPPTNLTLDQTKADPLFMDVWSF